MRNCVDALTLWTGKFHASIVEDNTVDEFNDPDQVERVVVNSNIATIVRTMDGDVFGGFFQFLSIGYPLTKKS